jgi:hypothetical protein
MDQLLSKFTNLGYEILGIFVPGLVLMLFLLFGWWCLGPLAGMWTFNFLPQARIREASGLLSLLNSDIRAGLLIVLVVGAYFLGHLLHWIARRPKNPVAKPSWYRRVWLCLTFAIPKPEHSYEPKLQPLLDAAKPFLGLGPQAEWRQFYPLAKAYLSANLQTSLVSTYQNKYTLHRSLTAAAVVWFWLSILATAGALIEICFADSQPLWFPLLLSSPLSLLLVWGFSDSYRYNWKLWGDTLITEIFMIQRASGK